MIGLFDKNGKYTGGTVIEVMPNIVVDKVVDSENRCIRVRLGYGERKLKNTPKPLRAIFERAKTSPKEKIMEFEWLGEGDVEYGKAISITDVFSEGERIKITGISKGKGFQGVVKRHGFAGVGARTHGQHNRERAPGSMGSTTFPGRVIKGKRMTGRMGNEKVSILNVEILKIMPEKNIMIVRGGVPGHRGSIVKLIK